VNLLRVYNRKYIFHLQNGERELLKLILRLYPVIPSTHQPLSKSSSDTNKEHQQLLDEALAEQRKENKKIVQAFLNDETHFRQLKTSWRLLLTAAEIEWLLQVLNDIRVGNWILLGSPDEDLSDLARDEKTAPHIWAMDFAGFFQSHLLEGLSKKTGAS
jgi:hypothetical protein